MKRKLSCLDNLIYINRYSGNLLIKNESVSDHVWGMNSLAMEFVPILNHKFNLKIPLSQVIYGIALHDLDECLYCDIPRNFKYHDQQLRDAISNTVDQLLEEYQLDPELIKDIKSVEDKKSLLGALIKILDIAQAGQKMKMEIRLGNTYFIDEIQNAVDSLEGLKEIITDSELEDKYKEALLWLSDEFIKELV